MNIFHLSKSPRLSAEYMCDKHIPKMLLESAQMLSTAIRRYTNLIVVEDLYKSAYQKHPMTIWVGDNRSNFMWALENAVWIDMQYSKRFNSTHKSFRIIDVIINEELDRHIPKGKLTTPPQCMPDEYKHKNYVTAYRRYYKGAKSYFAKWNRLNNTPKWWVQ